MLINIYFSLALLRLNFFNVFLQAFFYCSPSQMYSKTETLINLRLSGLARLKNQIFTRIIVAKIRLNCFFVAGFILYSIFTQVNYHLYINHTKTWTNCPYERSLWQRRQTARKRQWEFLSLRKNKKYLKNCKRLLIYLERMNHKQI